MDTASTTEETLAIMAPTHWTANCPHCKRLGFVRHERQISGTRVVDEHYCGACNRTWFTTEDGIVIDKPIHSIQDYPYRDWRTF